MSDKRTLEVCISPDLTHLFDFNGKIAVIIDILRATSSITSGLATGVKSIVPVSHLEECKELQQKGYLAAAERNGEMPQGFNLGNSPYSYMCDEVKGKSIAMTTTNGTKTLNLCLDSEEIVIGSFLNLKAIVKYLMAKEQNVVLVCRT